MSKPVSYKRHRFPPEIIAHAVWLYLRFPLSLRLIEEMLLERGILVSYETVRRWALKFGPTHFARTYVGLLLAPISLALYRVVIAESARFPQLGRAVFEAGPAIASARLGA